jgi:hypothetical protein
VTTDYLDFTDLFSAAGAESSADFQSAVSQNFILQTDQACQTAQVNSITMQVKNLRYSPADARRRGTLRPSGWLLLFEFENSLEFRASVFGLFLRFPSLDTKTFAVTLSGSVYGAFSVGGARVSSPQEL